MTKTKNVFQMREVCSFCLCKTMRAYLLATLYNSMHYLQVCVFIFIFIMYGYA